MNTNNTNIQSQDETIVKHYQAKITNQINNQSVYGKVLKQSLREVIQTVSVIADPSLCIQRIFTF